MGAPSCGRGLQHRLVNLTILKTAWNEEIRRCSFAEKRTYFRQSRLWLKDCFSGMGAWTADNIADRTDTLPNEMMKVWPFGRVAPSQ